MLKLFKVQKAGVTVTDSQCETKAEAKVIRDKCNKEAGWVKNEQGAPDNCNSMPYKVTKGVDHWNCKWAKTLKKLLG